MAAAGYFDVVEGGPFGADRLPHERPGTAPKHSLFIAKRSRGRQWAPREPANR